MECAIPMKNDGKWYDTTTDFLGCNKYATEAARQFCKIGVGSQSASPPSTPSTSPTVTSQRCKHAASVEAGTGTHLGFRV